MIATPFAFQADNSYDVARVLRAMDGGPARTMRTTASVPEFLKSESPNGPTCLVLDVRLPRQSGLDFQGKLVGANVQMPIIFITAHGDIPMSVQAMKGGAIEFLTKPYRDQVLIDAIHVGLARDRVRLENEKELDTFRAHFESLSAREREIMAQVVQGRLSRQIAHDIGISENTVHVHRRNLNFEARAGNPRTAWRA